jgi:hypothetical protein
MLGMLMARMHMLKLILKLQVIQYSLLSRKLPSFRKQWFRPIQGTVSIKAEILVNEYPNGFNKSKAAMTKIPSNKCIYKGRNGYEDPITWCPIPEPAPIPGPTLFGG